MNASSSEKVQTLLSTDIKIHQHVSLEQICAYFSPDSDKMTLSLEKTILWIEDYFSWKQ